MNTFVRRTDQPIRSGGGQRTFAHGVDFLAELFAEGHCDSELKRNSLLFPVMAR